jgi:hypothetical protein
LGIALLLAGPAAAQNDPRDFSGLWEGGPGSDISDDLLPGEEISLTPFAAQRYRSLDQAKSPANTCLPYGPTRALNSVDVQHWVQTPTELVVLYEQMSHYRLIYTDGRQHAADAIDYPSWMGHSIGRWEGNVFVVDTVGLDERSWLDSGGLEHSDKMHMIERYEKIDGNTLKVTVTIEDPVFFTKPFTYSINKVRANLAETPRILPQICNENEKDAEHMFPDPPQHRNPPKFSQ